MIRYKAASVSPYRRLFVALAVFVCVSPSALLGQIRINVVRGNGIEPAGEVVDYGVIPSGDVKSLDFRLKNEGNAPFTLQLLRLNGDGANRVFRFQGEPSLPRILGPGLSVAFSVRFEPSNPGQWQVTLEADSGAKTVLKGAATASLNLYVEGEASPLPSGTAVSFGSVKAGKSVSRKFTLKNEAKVALPVGLFLVTGESFRKNGGSVPATLQAGEQAVFEVLFAPGKPGLHAGAIEFGERRVVLDGFALEPEMPRVKLALERTVVASGEQGTVGVNLESAAEYEGSGQLEIRLEPAVSGMPPDPAVVFVESGKATVPFTVRKGDTKARFATGLSASFQAGTTAGKVWITASMAGYTDTASVEVQKSAPRLTAARTTTQTGQLTVDVTGFDNTRSISRVSFQFYSRNDAPLGGSLRAEVSDLFHKYFETSQTGGTFLMKAWFPVQGDVTQIGTVEIEMENSAGVTRTQRISF